MTEEGVFPAIVYVFDGGITRRLEGFHDTQVVGTRLGKTDILWTLGNFGGRPVYELVGREHVRVFYCDMSVPEFALPMEVARDQLIEWRQTTLSGALLPDGQLNKAYLQTELGKLGATSSQSIYLAKVFTSGARPDTMARVYQRRWMDGLMATGEAVWPYALAGAGLGFMQGWQSADTFLPNIASNPYFGLLLPLALIVILIIASFRKG